jgi:glycine cleavage system regulatory protein
MHSTLTGWSTHLNPVFRLSNSVFFKYGFSYSPEVADMQKAWVMTIMGRDRTGLVESLAKLIADSGGNWLESRMCRLGGEFAGILRVGAPENQEKEFLQSLQELKSQGLTVVIQQDEAQPVQKPAHTAILSLIGHDRPGIIYQISAVLAQQKINVEELETECSSAPMSGDLIFNATARLQIPATCDVAELRKNLEEIGSELMVDISFTQL